MAILSEIEKRNLITGILKVVRAKATKIGLENGAVGICYVDDATFTSKKGISCFDLLPGETCLRIFALKKGGSHVVLFDDGKEKKQCFGMVAEKIAAATKAYEDTGGYALTSESCRDEDNIPGRWNYGGCVLYPITINDQLCGRIYVAVSGGTQKQDIACAWEAYKIIKDGMVACKTANPGPVRYGKDD